MFRVRYLYRKRDILRIGLSKFDLSWRVWMVGRNGIFPGAAARIHKRITIGVDVTAALYKRGSKAKSARHFNVRRSVFCA